MLRYRDTSRTRRERAAPSSKWGRDRERHAVQVARPRAVSRVSRRTQCHVAGRNGFKSRRVCCRNGKPEREVDEDARRPLIYIQDKKSKDGLKQFWKCPLAGSCRARLHTLISAGEVAGEGADVLRVHSDEANPATIEVAGRKHALKRRAMETQEPRLQQIEDAFEMST